MIRHIDISPDELHRRLKDGSITLGGYQAGKIYGTLTCWSGKRMARENRVFFNDVTEARALGYRPCGHCMRPAYLDWKAAQNSELSRENSRDRVSKVQREI